MRHFTTNGGNLAGNSRHALPMRTDDDSFVESLRRIVRRVLRTRSRSNPFEISISDRARTLLETQCREWTREGLVRVIVEELLRACGEERKDVSSSMILDPCAGTQAVFCNATIVC